MRCNIDDITAILPHRRPFLFVDRVIEIYDNNRIVAEKSLAYEDPVFDGHFPNNPIMPGVLVAEALAQTSGLLLGLEWKKENPSWYDGNHQFFLAHVNVKFFSPAKPGDTIRLEAELKKTYGKFYLFHVTASTDDSRIAEGELTLALEERSP